EGVERSLGGVGSLPGRFQSPAGLAVDEEGFLYVADSGNHRIQKLNPEGQPVAQWGGWGAQPGLVSYPSGLACVGDRLYVADYANHRVQVFDRSGRLLKQWGAAPAVAGGGDGRLHYPEGLAVSPSGGLTVVSEPVEGRLQVFVNRDVAKVERVNDLPWWDGLHTRLHAVRLAPPPPGCKPQVIGALAASDVHAVFFFDVTTNALGPIAAAGGYGPKLGELNGIGGIAVDPEGSRAYVGDVGNRRIVLFELPRNPARRELFANTIRVVSSHSLARMVPAGTSGYSAEMATPGPISRGRNGRLYVLDRANQAILVCDPDLRFLSLIPVSQGVREFAVADDGSLVATDPLRSRVLVYGSDGREQAVWTLGEERTGPGEGMPWGVAIDDQGVVYISDALNDRILKVDREGRVLKRWGTTGRTNDRLSGPRSIAFYSPDRLIIEDYGNHRAQLCTTEGEWLGNYVAGGLATPIAIR
ncbi:MAG TPA: NHL repeat-containing protein, partial [Planctomycetota bacterium]|nr:NHL repeat-containing protein [Planctomycetota bacterium]